MLIPRRIRQALGIHSPSKAFHDPAEWAHVAASASTAEAEERLREKLDRALATQRAMLERRHEAEMAEAERLNSIALLRADAWERRDAKARDAALTEAWLAIRAVAGPWPYDLKDALDAVHALRTGVKSAEAAKLKLDRAWPKAEPADCCADGGHAEAGETDE